MKEEDKKHYAKGVLKEDCVVLDQIKGLVTMKTGVKVQIDELLKEAIDLLKKKYEKKFDTKIS